MQAIERAEAAVAGDLICKFLREGDILALTRIDLEAVEPLIELPDFFPQCHAREQILCAHLRRKRFVLIRFHITSLFKQDCLDLKGFHREAQHAIFHRQLCLNFFKQIGFVCVRHTGR